MAFWGRDPRAWDKGAGAGPVSEADLAVDRFLRESLTAARPDHGWLSEETADTADRLDRGPLPRRARLPWSLAQQPLPP